MFVGVLGRLLIARFVLLSGLLASLAPAASGQESKREKWGGEETKASHGKCLRA
jgi:hypothetical protein